MTEPKYLDRPLDEPMPDHVLAEILAETQRGLPIDCGIGGRIIAELRARTAAYWTLDGAYTALERGLDTSAALVRSLDERLAAANQRYLASLADAAILVAALSAERIARANAEAEAVRVASENQTRAIIVHTLAGKLKYRQSTDPDNDAFRDHLLAVITNGFAAPTRSVPT